MPRKTGGAEEFRRWTNASLGLLLVFAFAGCASTELTADRAYDGPPLARPDRIIVEDFGATPGDVWDGSELSSEATGATPQSAEDVELGRQLGAEVARQLTLDIQNMGLPAVQAAGQPPARPGDIVIKGDFFSIDQGSEVRRVLLGFGSGAAELRTAVEVYQMTPGGLRLLGSGSSDAGGGKLPGMAAPVLIFAATHNPIGLIVVGATKVYGEASGRSTIEGAAKRTADAIAERLKVGAERQGWLAVS